METHSNVRLISNVHVRQRGVEARDDVGFRNAIFSRDGLLQLFPELLPGPAGIDQQMLRIMLSASQTDYFSMLPCPLCGRKDYWYRRSGNGHQISRCACMCQRADDAASGM
jgi:hypothetical protein